MGNFLVIIDGFEPMSMTSVTGIGFEVAVLEDAEARNGNGRAPGRSPGVNKNTTVTISTMELEKAAQLGCGGTRSRRGRSSASTSRSTCRTPPTCRS